MKIQNINLFSFNPVMNKTAVSNPVQASNFDYNKTLHPQEI